MSKLTELFTSTKELRESIKSLHTPHRVPVKPEVFKSEVKAILLVALEMNNNDPEKVIELLDKPHNTLSNRFTPLYGDYQFAHQRYEQITDLISQSDDAEVRAHRRNLKYRTATTIAVGLPIMGIYALAHYLEIPMPLMRLPVPS